MDSIIELFSKNFLKLYKQLESTQWLKTLISASKTSKHF